MITTASTHKRGSHTRCEGVMAYGSHLASASKPPLRIWAPSFENWTDATDSECAFTNSAAFLPVGTCQTCEPTELGCKRSGGAVMDGITHANGATAQASCDEVAVFTARQGHHRFLTNHVLLLLHNEERG